MPTLGEILIKLTGDASGLQRAVDQGKRSLNEIPAAAQSSLGQATTHVSRFGSALASVGTVATSVGRTLVSVAAVGAGAFAALTIGAAALATRLTGPIRAMADLNDEAFALGTTAEELSKLEAGARLVGLQFTDFRTAVGMFAMKMAEARDTTSAAAITFAKLHVDITQGPIVALKQFAKALADLPNSVQAVELSREFLGGKVGPKFIAWGADLENLENVAVRSGQVVSNQMAKMSDATADAIDIMHGAFRGFSNRAVEPLLKPLKDASDRLTEFLTQDPRGIELAQRLTTQLGDALDTVTSPSMLVGIGDLVEQFGNLAGTTAQAVGSMGQLVPALTTVIGLIGQVTAELGKLPPEVIAGLVAGGITYRVTRSPVAAIGVGTAAAFSTGQQRYEQERLKGTVPTAPITVMPGTAAEVSQLTRQREYLQGELSRILSSPAAGRMGSEQPRGILMVAPTVPGTTQPERRTEAEVATELRHVDERLAALTGPPRPPAPPSEPGGEKRGPIVPGLGAAGERERKAAEDAAKRAAGDSDRAARAAERYTQWLAKQPAMIEDVRDAEERLAVTRDAVIKEYEATVRKPTFTESLALDYFGTMADALDDADREAQRLTERLGDLTDAETSAAVQASAFQSALEVLFGQGPIENRVADMLQRRFATIMDALSKSVEDAAKRQTQRTGQASTTPWTDYIKETFGFGAKTTGTLGSIEAVGTKILNAASIAQAGAQVVADTITGIRDLRDVVDKLSEQPGVTSSELYAAGSSRLPFIGKFLEPFNQITTSILGKNAPATATGALGGATAGAAIGMFGGPMGAAIGAAIGAALGALLGKLFQAPTAEAQLNRALARYVEQAGIPRVLPGERGINLRAFGRAGGPAVPAYADLDVQQAGFAGRMFATEAGRLPERDRIPGRVQQFLVNTATALKLTADEADRLFRRFEQPLMGKNLEDALLRLTSLRAQGRITASDMQAGFARALQIFEDLPDAINTSRLALAAFDEAGRVNFQTLQRAAEDAQKVIVEGMGATFQTLVQTGSAEAAGRNLATSFAGTFLEAVQQELAAVPLSSALTDAVVMARQAAVAFREGDRQEARRLLVDARREFMQGRQELLNFLQPIASDTRGWTQGMTGAAGFINQVNIGLPKFEHGGVVEGLPGQPILAILHAGERVQTAQQASANVTMPTKIPSFDVGGLVPGPVGQPMLATVHGGEFVLRSQDTQEMVGLLRQMAGAVQRGWSVVIQDRSVHTLQVDGRELARVQAETERLHRGTGLVVPRGDLGVR